MKPLERIFRLTDVSKGGLWYGPGPGQTLERLPQRRYTCDSAADEALFRKVLETDGKEIESWLGQHPGESGWDSPRFYHRVTLPDLAAIFGLGDLLEEMFSLLCQEEGGMATEKLVGPFVLAILNQRDSLLERLHEYFSEQVLYWMDTLSGMPILNAAVLVGRSDYVNRLLERVADVRIDDRNGLTPLHLAAATGNIEIMRSFLMYHLDWEQDSQELLSEGSKFICSPEKLFTGKLRGQWMTFCKHLSGTVDRGTIPYGNTLPSYTTLDLAAMGGHAECADLLLKMGANPTIENEKGFNAPLCAMASGSPDTFRLFLDHSTCGPMIRGWGEECLWRLAELPWFDGEAPNLIWKNGWESLPCDSDGMSVLDRAIRAGNTGFMKYLLGKGAAVNGPNDRGQTPLMTAAGCGEEPALHLLLESGADPDLRDPDGKSALHLLARTHPLDLACHKTGPNGNPQLLAEGLLNSAQTLVGHGADPRLKDAAGATPLDLARHVNDGQDGFFTAVEVFLEGAEERAKLAVEAVSSCGKADSDRDVDLGL